MPAKDQPKRGRPSDYCAEIAMTICEQIADGQSLRRICAGAGMPDKATVLRWIACHKEFQDWYTHARVFQADESMDEILEIADRRAGGWVKTIGTDGKSGVVLGPEDLNSRLRRIKARWWLVARMAPRKYGR